MEYCQRWAQDLNACSLTIESLPSTTAPYWGELGMCFRNIIFQYYVFLCGLNIFIKHILLYNSNIMHLQNEITYRKAFRVIVCHLLFLYKFKALRDAHIKKYSCFAQQHLLYNPC